MAEEEDEKRKREMQQLLSGFLQLTVKEDGRKTKLNALKVDLQWRDLLREAKSKEIKDDLLLMKESFTKAVDYKDAVINALIKEVQQIEVQNMWTACNHMNSLEQLIAVEEQRSKQLLEQYEADIEKLRKSFEEVKQEAEAKMQSETSHFKDLDFIEDVVFQNYSHDAKMKFILIQEGIVDEVSREKADIMDAFDCQISKTWRQFQVALVKYLEDADAMEKLFTELKSEYNKLITDTLQDHKVAEELKKSIPQLKAQLVQKERDYKERVKEVVEGNEDFYCNASNLKDKMAKIRIQDKTSLTQLVVNSNAAIQTLKKLHEKGEKIIRLYKRCQKMEAEAGLGDSNLKSYNLGQEDIKRMGQVDIDSEMPSDFQYIGVLQSLWEVQNKVTLQNLALERELDELQLLQTKLQSNMFNFFQKVSDGKIDKNETPNIEQPASKVTIQEAALLARNLSKHQP